MIHFDVMDGEFVPNLGFAPWMIRSLRDATTLPFEAHLMVRHPERHLESLAAAGVDIVIIRGGRIRSAHTRPDSAELYEGRIGHIAGHCQAVEYVVLLTIWSRP